MPAQLLGDPSFIARLSWETIPRIPTDQLDLPAAIRDATDYDFFCDTNFIIEPPQAGMLEELLASPGRLRITREVETELQPWLGRNPSHAIARALATADPAVVRHPPAELGRAGTAAFDYYVALLAIRRNTPQVAREILSERNGRPAEQQDEREVLDLIQRELGQRARLIASKPKSPLLTDEVLVYQAMEHALRTGTPTVIISRDPDIEEQLFKLVWLLNSHYRAMLCAEAYANDFGRFQTRPVVSRHLDHPDWPVERPGSVLVDMDHFGPQLDGVLPRSGQFVPIACWTVGELASYFIFGGERAMSRVLDMKDRTLGNVSDGLGAGRNLHTNVPRWMLPPNDEHTYVLIARDRANLETRSGSRLAYLDVLMAKASGERPQHVELQGRFEHPVEVARTILPNDRRTRVMVTR